MSKSRGFIAVWLLALLAALCAVPNLNAHDTGFGHSRRTIFITAQPGGYQIEYRLTLTAEEALLELVQTSKPGDQAAQDGYFRAQGNRLAQGLICREGDNPRPVRLQSYELGVSLTQTYRFTVAAEAAEILLTDVNFPHKPGHVRVLVGRGVAVELAEPTDLNHAERVSLRIRRKQ